MNETLTSNPFLLAFGLVFLAELGDKTQLIALAFATRYRMTPVLIGVVLGTASVTAVSVGLGATIGQFLSDHWLKIATGALLMLFAVLIVRESGEDEDEQPRLTGRYAPVIGVSLTFFVAEIGDKTMLATMGIATQSDRYFLVWAGATIGMVLANLIGIGLGRLAGKRLPEQMIRWVAGTLFFASGVIILIDGIRSVRSLR